MSLFLILLAAGDSKRFKSNIPKPFNMINNKTLLELSLDAFKDFSAIKIEGNNVVVEKNSIYLKVVSEPNLPFLLSLKIL